MHLHTYFELCSSIYLYILPRPLHSLHVSHFRMMRKSSGVITLCVSPEETESWVVLLIDSRKREWDISWWGCIWSVINSMLCLKAISSAVNNAQTLPHYNQNGTSDFFSSTTTAVGIIHRYRFLQQLIKINLSNIHHTCKNICFFQ